MKKQINLIYKLAKDDLLGSLRHTIYSYEIIAYKFPHLCYLPVETSSCQLEVAAAYE